MVRQVGPSNAKWHVRAAGDFTMTSQRKSELEAVNRRLARNDPMYASLPHPTQFAVSTEWLSHCRTAHVF
jgi:hypothetical protein